MLISQKFNTIWQIQLPKENIKFVSRSPCLSVRYRENDWFWCKLTNPLFTNRLLFEIYSWEEKIFNEIKNDFIWTEHFTNKINELFFKQLLNGKYIFLNFEAYIVVKIIFNHMCIFQSYVYITHMCECVRMLCMCVCMCVFYKKMRFDK